MAGRILNGSVMQAVQRPASQRRARRRVQVALAGAGEAAERLRDLGAALDSLVRSLRQNDALADGFGRRAHQSWLVQPERRLELLPTELRAGGRVALAASNERGRFILPAYNAGLRALTLRDTSSPHDVMMLGEQLAALQDEPRALQRFAQWLWCSTAFGLEAHLVESLPELGESVVRAVPESELWAERSSRAVEIWNEMAWSAAQSLPRASVEQRFARPLADAERRAAAGELDLADSEVGTLGALVDDPASWTWMEVALLRHDPSLRAALSPSHLSWILSSLIEHAPRLDQELLAVLRELGCDLRRGEGASATDQLDYRVLGMALADRLLELAVEAPVPEAVLDALGSSLRGTVVSAVCEQGEDYPSGPALIAALARRWGVDELFKRVELAALGPVMAAALAGCALDARAEPASLMAWVARLPLPAALGALAGVPALLAHARPLIERALSEQPVLAGAYLPPLVRSGQAAAALVGSALLASGARDVPEDVLSEVLAALLEQGQGRSAVLPLFERTSHGVTPRRCALLALQADPRLLHTALGAVDRTNEPSEIRQLLEELRWKIEK
ncbi:MAG TPA: hypothetical protein VK509_01090 [Polyangiales bacterium]|nr:hypothetical protein [Polyangiales bacterium]